MKIPSAVDQDLTRVPGAPWQYELHLWTWRDNPTGGRRRR